MQRAADLVVAVGALAAELEHVALGLDRQQPVRSAGAPLPASCGQSDRPGGIIEAADELVDAKASAGEAHELHRGGGVVFVVARAGRRMRAGSVDAGSAVTAWARRRLATSASCGPIGVRSGQ